MPLVEKNNFAAAAVAAEIDPVSVAAEIDPVSVAAAVASAAVVELDPASVVAAGGEVLPIDPLEASDLE